MIIVKKEVFVKFRIIRGKEQCRNSDIKRNYCYVCGMNFILILDRVLQEYADAGAFFKFV